MAIALKDYILDETGAGVGGVTVEVYRVVGGVQDASPTNTTTTDGAGLWSFTGLTTGGGESYSVKMIQGAKVRWRYPNIKIMATEIIGPDGVAPIPDGSVTGVKVVDGSQTDAKLGNRTADQTIAAAVSNTGTLTQLLSWIVKIILGITGKADWKTAPAITLEALSDHSARHATGGADPITAADIDAVKNAGSVPQITSGATRPASGSVTNEVYIDTSGDNLGIWQWSGSAWVQIADASGSLTETDAFGSIAVSGSNTVTADAPDDTVTFVPGTGIDITSTGNQITFSAEAAADSFGSIAVSGQTTVTADTDDDQVTFVAGSGIVITTSGNTVTFTASGGSAIENASGQEAMSGGNVTISGTTNHDLITTSSLPAGTYLFYFSAYYLDLDEGGMIDFRLKVGASQKTKSIYSPILQLSEDTMTLEGTVSGTWIETLASTSTVTLTARGITGTGALISDGDETTLGYVRLA